ncbi:hypothetical protein Cgig2_027685 [Carnegiea gigantea]|uniref:Uncharacterized protein n=1 Tax=Carnegiea gigantea TaxID=171969 RepID=A0A9Q1GX08_9CARY|nr:hypothetical protein Cgig2_027685 [Carnegiea gigantea]
MRPGTFIITSFMASGVGYCLPTVIFVSIYKGLNEISCFSHPSRGRGYFPAHFLYTWLAKSSDTYELAGHAFSSPGIVKFSGFSQAKSFQLEKETLLDDGKLSRVGFAFFVSIHSSFVSYHLDLDNLPNLEIMLHCHHVLTRYGTGSQLLHSARCNLLQRNTTRAFYERWSKMFISLTCSPHTSDSKRKRSDLFDINISKDEGKLGSKPKLKIVRFEKPLEPFVLPIEDVSSRVNISGIDVAVPATPISAILIQSIAQLPHITNDIKEHFESSPFVSQVPKSDDVNFKEELAHVPLPSQSKCFPSIGQIPSFGKDLYYSGSRLGLSKGVCSPNNDEVESIHRTNAPSVEVDKNAIQVFDKVILDNVFRTPFNGLPSIKGDFDNLYATILQSGVDATTLENKAEGLIKQAYDLKDL